MKRVLDIISALLGLLFLAPLLLALAILIKLDSPGPVFYLAHRVGKDGKPFRLYKFRTMTIGANKQGPAITTAGDSRVTRIGRLLRRTKLDEIPQLLNVVKGEMSLVGPRPEDPRYVALYTEEQRQILTVRPGITSAASLVYRREEEMLLGSNWEEKYLTEVMPTKLAIDLAYIEQRTVWTDLKLIVRTLLSLLQ